MTRALEWPGGPGRFAGPFPGRFAYRFGNRPRAPVDPCAGGPVLPNGRARHTAPGRAGPRYDKGTTLRYAAATGSARLWTTGGGPARTAAPPQARRLAAASTRSSVAVNATRTCPAPALP